MTAATWRDAPCCYPFCKNMTTGRYCHAHTVVKGFKVNGKGCYPMEEAVKIREGIHTRHGVIVAIEGRRGRA